MPQQKKSDSRAANAIALSSRTSAKSAAKKRKAARTVQMNRSGTAPKVGMRRPRPRRRPSAVTAQFGRVSPRKVRRETGVRAFSRSARQSVQTVKVRGARLPWATLFAALCCTVIIMAMVFNYVRLNELTNQYRTMQNEVVNLTASRKKLTLALEQKNDLLAIEQAAGEAGMVKSDRVEKRYINMENEDKIEVPDENTGAIARFFSDVKDAVTDAFRNIFG